MNVKDVIINWTFTKQYISEIKFTTLTVILLTVLVMYSSGNSVNLRKLRKNSFAALFYWFRGILATTIVCICSLPSVLTFLYFIGHTKLSLLNFIPGGPNVQESKVGPSVYNFFLTTTRSSPDLTSLYEITFIPFAMSF